MSKNSPVLATVLLVVDPDHPEAVETLTGTHTYLVDAMEESYDNPQSPIFDGASVVSMNFERAVQGVCRDSATGTLLLKGTEAEPKVRLNGDFDKHQLASLLLELTRREMGQEIWNIEK